MGITSVCKAVADHIVNVVIRQGGSLWLGSHGAIDFKNMRGKSQSPLNFRCDLFQHYKLDYRDYPSRLQVDIDIDTNLEMG